MQEMWVRSLGQEDPLEKEMATHSSILAWEIPRAEEPGGLQSMGLQEVRHDLGLSNNTKVDRLVSLLTVVLKYKYSVFGAFFIYQTSNLVKKKEISSIMKC